MVSALLKCFCLPFLKYFLISLLFRKDYVWQVDKGDVIKVLFLAQNDGNPTKCVESLKLFPYIKTITKTCLNSIDPIKSRFYIVKLRFTG